MCTHERFASSLGCLLLCPCSTLTEPLAACLGSLTRIILLQHITNPRLLALATHQTRPKPRRRTLPLQAISAAIDSVSQTSKRSIPSLLRRCWPCYLYDKLRAQSFVGRAVRTSLLPCVCARRDIADITSSTTLTTRASYAIRAPHRVSEAS
jgi:hypothetical protein